MKNISFVKSLVFLLIIFLHGCGGGSSYGDNSSSNITGTLAKGTVTQAIVKAYKADGTLIGETTEIIDSKYSIALNGYTGKVKVVTHIYKYLDEKTALLVKVQALELNAIATITSTDTTVNVTPLTDIASKLLGIDKGVSFSELSEDTITSINKLTAYSLTSKEFNPTKEGIKILVSGDNNIDDSNPVRYGLALSAISADSNITLKDDTLTNSKKVITTINKIVDLIRNNNLVDLDAVVQDGLTESNNSLINNKRDIVPEDDA
ncbi:MAG: hypothetical protein ACI81I_000766, partial [Arcobacteraceae bacterium]